MKEEPLHLTLLHAKIHFFNMALPFNRNISTRPWLEIFRGKRGVGSFPFLFSIFFTNVFDLVLQGMCFHKSDF